MEASQLLRGFDIADKLRSALVLCRLRRDITAPPVLASEAVRAVEAELGSPVPDPVWAWLAAAGRDPYQVLTLTADGHEEHRLPRRLIAFERDHRHGTYFCVQRRAAELSLCSVWEWDGSRAVETWHDLASFVRSRQDLAAGPLPGGIYQGERERFELELAAFAPGLVDRTEDRSARRVRHPRFGDGVVVQELPSTPAKVQVDFGAAGIKIMMSSHLDDLLAPGGAASHLSPAAFAPDTVRLPRPPPPVRPRRRVAAVA
ncbi:MAG: hypothetical protein JRI23_23915 [Deltaproteobacteria bacterium]|jgi:hypothetical protein|nr:hypothetical protein [Deltaproteobacteria bacterium]MBW2535039.1 hypothetical protein [Deltaproteobacteria bacterium]